MGDKNNTGKENSGNWNSGNWNSGNWNSGDWNSGNRNSGYRNSGYRNSGDWNQANFHVGCFNTIDAESAYYFNTLTSKEEWDGAVKPDWIYNPSPTTWVSENDMIDQEKIDHPDFHVCQGYLRQNDMKEEWRKAYDAATPEDIELTRQLPNFDAKVFEEITGIDLSVERPSAPKEIKIDGATYVLKT